MGGIKPQLIMLQAGLIRTIICGDLKEQLLTGSGDGSIQREGGQFYSPSRLVSLVIREGTSDEKTSY